MLVLLRVGDVSMLTFVMRQHSMRTRGMNTILGPGGEAETALCRESLVGHTWRAVSLRHRHLAAMCHSLAVCSACSGEAD